MLSTEHLKNFDRKQQTKKHRGGHTELQNKEKPTEPKDAFQKFRFECFAVWTSTNTLPAILWIGPLLEISVQRSESLYFFCFLPRFSDFLDRSKEANKKNTCRFPFFRRTAKIRCFLRKRKNNLKKIPRAHKEVKCFCSPRKRNTFASGFPSFSLFRKKDERRRRQDTKKFLKIVFERFPTLDRDDKILVLFFFIKLRM